MSEARVALQAPSMALQPYAPAEERRVHLADLSGLFEIVALAVVAWAIGALRKREISLSKLAHTLTMSSVLLVGGHFVEEHVLGVAKLEALLRFGFPALGA